MYFLGVGALFAVVFFEVAVAVPVIGLATDSDVSLSSAYLPWPPSVLTTHDLCSAVGTIAVEMRDVAAGELDAAIVQRGEPLYSIITDDGELFAIREKQGPHC